MLVLSRKLEEEIKIGDNITVTVLRVKGSTVKIGITAPRDVRVMRGELPNASGPVSSGSVSTGLGDPAEVMVLEAALDAEEEPLERPTAAPKVESRLPQRRPFARYGQPPLRLVVGAGALAK